MRIARLIITFTLGLGLILALVWLLGEGRLPVARAASFFVDVTYDENDGSCLDGDCSLRDAIIIANGSSGADVIALGSGTYTLTLTGTGEDAAATGDLDITDVLTLTGAGAGQTIIDASGVISDRVLDVRSGAGTVVISGVTIINGNVTGNGGGICSDGADLTLVNTIVGSNVATGTYPSGYGGGMYVRGGSATLEGVQIFGNTSVVGGGGVYVNSGDAVLTGTEILSNTGGDNGGGVYFVSGSATLSNTRVLSNSAAYGGGAYISSASATLEGGQVYGNHARRYGGGMHVNSSDVALTGTRIVANTAGENGAGAYVSGSGVTLNEGQILSNTASARGGGVYVDNDTATFTQTGDSLVAYNVVTGTGYQFGGGGGVYVRWGRAMLKGGQVLSNTSGVDGGGVYARVGNLTFGEIEVVGNTADQDGGGAYVYEGSATLSGTQVVSNTAGRDGGGLCAVDGSATLSETHVLSNTAGGRGGGLCIGLGSAVVRGGEVRGNTANGTGFADGGGGVHLWSGNVVMSGVPVVGNTAMKGGGLYTHESGGTLTLVNATVSRNVATAGDGGGLRNNLGTVVLTYTTIASNTATGGGGGIHTESGPVLMQDMIIAHNGPVNCSGVLISNGHNLDSGTACGFSATGDITGTDPLLRPLAEDGGTLVHALLLGSPAIDHGVCLAEPTVDQRGVSRPQGHTCDIGAYEFVLVAPASVSIDGPADGIVGKSITFTATVSPPTATPPITYTWSPAPDTGQGTDVATYSWATTGKKTVTVTAENGAGAAPPASHEVEIADYKVYLPAVVRE